MLLELWRRGIKLNGLVKYNECDVRHVYRLSEILNHNEQSALLLVAIVYMYTKLQTQ